MGPDRMECYNVTFFAIGLSSDIMQPGRLRQHGLTLLLSCIWLLSTGRLLAAPLELVASNQPLALLAAAVVPVGVRITVLVSPTADPHHFQLLPSQAGGLQKADLLVWQGPELEPALASVAVNLAADRQLIVPAYPDDPAYGHAWLSPDGALSIAGAIALQLQPRLPQSAVEITDRLESLTAAVRSQEATARKALQGLPDRSFIALHDAFTPLAHAFGLQSLGALITAHGTPVGARSLWQLETALAGRRATCVLVQPQFADSALQAIAGQHVLAPTEIDPQADGWSIGADSFAAYYGDVLRRLVSCLVAGQPAS